MDIRLLHNDNGTDPCIHYECWSLFGFSIETSLSPLFFIVPYVSLMFYYILYVAPYDVNYKAYNSVPVDEL